MNERPGTDADTARSYRLDRLAGFCVIGAFVLSLALLFVGHPLFWIPFALGLGIGLPGFAILADRERDRSAASAPERDDGFEDDDDLESDDGAQSDEGGPGDDGPESLDDESA